MCGILGFFNTGLSKIEVEERLNLIQHRGLDGKKLIEFNAFGNKHFLAHNLHSIVGHVSQPFEDANFIFATNCEIYNWKELDAKYKFNSKNDAHLLFNILKLKMKDELLNCLDELDGVYSFYIINKDDSTCIIARDIFGVKPLWFNYSNTVDEITNVGKTSFSFASEKQSLEHNDLTEELNPRNIIIYNYETKNIEFKQRNFYNPNTIDNINKIEENDIDSITNNVKELLTKAIEKRIPERKVGVLFSGGIDSTVICQVLRKQNIPFKAYITTYNNASLETAKKIAEELNFELEIIHVNTTNLKENLSVVIKSIQSANPIKVEVGLTLYLSMKKAKEDGCKVIFSGLGADDIFGGYHRMQQTNTLTMDTISNLRRIYERDLYRDDVLSMKSGLELRLPFLDKKLVDYVISLRDEIKIGDETKYLLRRVAREIEIPLWISKAKRQAAQYSSGIQKAVDKLIKENSKNLTGEKYKKDYFSKILGHRNMKIASLLSTGKDSVYALHIMERLNYDVACCITIKSHNKDSYMFHTPAVDLAKLQSESMNIPLLIQETKGEEEKELGDLYIAIKTAKEKYNIQGIVSGAVFSNYQRTRIERICDELNLKVYSPLWHIPQEKLMETLLKEGFEFIFTKVAGFGLDLSWLGRVINKDDVEKLKKLQVSHGIHVAGEGGEFESLVLNAPLFRKQLSVVGKAESSGEFEGEFIVEKAYLE